MSSTLSFVTLDVFTTTRYIGNPVAVVWVPHNLALTQTQKQQITREFNLSETVFLHEQTVEDESKSLARIDIFTPLTEVPFAGHPTVGTANYLLRLGDSSVSSHASLKSVKTLQTKAGPVPIVLSPNPAIPGVQISVAHNIRIHASPFASYSSAWGKYPVVSIVRGMTFILARLDSLDSLESKSGNLLGTENTLKASKELDEGWREGIVGSYFYVDLGFDGGEGEGKVRNVRTRMFGSREDPATGSAASALCSYLSLQVGRTGRFQYRITQGVEMGRKSEIFIEVGVGGDGESRKVEEVLLSGSAVLNLQGTLVVPE